MQFDAFSVVAKPFLPLRVQIMTWRVIEDQEDLLFRVPLDEELEKAEEARAIKDIDEFIGEAGVIEGNGAINMGRFSLPSSGYAWSYSATRPGSMESGVDLKTCFILEEDDATYPSCFFLMAGSLFFSH
jgi:hypothetical protein